MPDLASRKLASTSWVLFPMDETIPIPVTTTRLMIASCLSWPRPDGASISDAAKEEAEQLPQGIGPQAARHHRIALEVAGKEPQVRLQLQNGPHETPAVFSAGLGNFGNPIEHEHRRQRQLRVALAE